VTDPLTAEQRRLVERAHRSVGPLANRIARQLGADEQELEGVGAEALVMAVRRYRPDTGVSFEAFAHYRVRGAMIDWFRKSNRAGRQRRRAQVALETTQALLEEAAEGTDERATLAERVRAAKRLVERTTAAVLVTRTSVDVDTQSGPNFESAMETRQTWSRVRDEIEALPPEERQLIRWIYTDGLTMKQAGERTGMSPATMSRRHTRVIGKLAERLRGPEDPR
jgi:RNA polymerase sigma factor for flagellar operon FliA